MIYVLTQGEYSDFTILGVYEGPDGVDMLKLREDFLRECYDDAAKVGKSEHKYSNGRVEHFAHAIGDAFQNYVVEKGRLRAIEYKDLESDGGCFGPHDLRKIMGLKP